MKASELLAKLEEGWVLERNIYPEEQDPDHVIYMFMEVYQPKGEKAQYLPQIKGFGSACTNFGAQITHLIQDPDDWSYKANISQRPWSCNSRYTIIGNILNDLQDVQ